MKNWKEQDDFRSSLLHIIDSMWDSPDETSQCDDVASPPPVDGPQQPPNQEARNGDATNVKANLNNYTP